MLFPVAQISCRSKTNRVIHSTRLVGGDASAILPGVLGRGSALGLSASWVGALLLAPFGSAVAAEDDVLLELHFNPVPHAQIAVWLEDSEGNFIQDVFVTQSTGTLGIGNRPGRWDFLSSWRFPYGPRPQVLPVWAHARGKTYPRLVWHDDDAADQDSLGWHENSSSPEPYFCRPLNADEHDTISTDTMTCPSPSTFQSDKGRFDGGQTSVYPPRGDLVEFEDGHDHPDAKTFSELNDLDAVTGATPVGNMPEMLTTLVPPEVASQGELVAWIEVNLEYDENSSYEFDRENDHYVDPRLTNFGIPYLGQPSVVYKVSFDPLEKAFRGTDAYAGYGEWDGSSGTVHPPDSGISANGGSGADRLQLYTKNDETFRFGVYSHGEDSGGSGTTGTTTGGGTDGDPGGWGGCEIHTLPAMTGVELEPVDFDRVRVHFTVPQLGDETEVKNVRLYYRRGTMPLDDANASSAIQSIPGPGDCAGSIEPGATTWCEVDELFGSSPYQIGIRYEDMCSNASSIVADQVTTPAQKFATVEGFCFVATAAWGAPWASNVQALRWFRDLYLKSSSVGYALVHFYYLNSPAGARLIARYPVARRIAQIVLHPLADLATVLTAR